MRRFAELILVAGLLLTGCMSSGSHSRVLWRPDEFLFWLPEPITAKAVAHAYPELRLNETACTKLETVSQKIAVNRTTAAELGEVLLSLPPEQIHAAYAVACGRVRGIELKQYIDRLQSVRLDLSFTNATLLEVCQHIAEAAQHNQNTTDQSPVSFLFCDYISAPPWRGFSLEAKGVTVLDALKMLMLGEQTRGRLFYNIQPDVIAVASGSHSLIGTWRNPASYKCVVLYQSPPYLLECIAKERSVQTEGSESVLMNLLREVGVPMPEGDFYAYDPKTGRVLAIVESENNVEIATRVLNLICRGKVKR